MGTQSSLEGVAALLKQLEALKSLDDGKDLRKAVADGIKPALARAEQSIPVGSVPHRLKETVGARSSGIKGQLVAPGYAKSALRTFAKINAAKNVANAFVGVRKAAFYATSFVERGIFGTRRKAADPWLVRSFAESRSECEEALRASLKRAVERAAKTK